MKELICEKCGGNLSIVQSHTNLLKCDYCGTSYVMESSGVVRKKVSFKSMVTYDRNSILLVSLIFMILLGFFLMPRGEKAEKLSKSGSEKISKPIEKLDVASTENTSEKESGDPEGVFEYSATKRSSNYTYYYGIYKNTGNIDIDKPTVQINFYDAQGEILDTSTGYGFKAILKPNEKTGLFVLVKDGKKFSKYEILNSPKKATYYPPTVPIKLHSTRLSKEGNMSYEIIGIAENIGENKAKFVHINGILYSADKKITGISSTFTSQDVLKPGDKSVFKLSFYGVETSNSYELEVESRLAE